MITFVKIVILTKVIATIQEQKNITIKTEYY